MDRRLGRGTDVGPRVVLVHAALVPAEREGAGVRGGGGGGGTEASRRRVESTRRLDPGVVPGLGVARAAPTARAGCATLLGPPDMPAKSAGPVSHDPSGVLNRSSKVGVSIPQLPVPAATSRGSKSGEVTGRVPRRPVTHSPGGVGACSRAWRGVRGCDTRGAGSGEAGVSSGSRDLHAGRKCSEQPGVVRAGTYRLSRRPARIGGADTPLAGPGRHSSRRARRLASLRSVLQRPPPRPARRPARMLNKTVGDRSVGQLGSHSCRFREFPLAAPRGLRLARWWRRYRNGARSTRRTCRTPRPTPTPTPTSLRAPSPTPPLAGSVGRSARRDARRETVQPLPPSEPPSR